jgi:prophage tail gpP-like protein
MSSVNEETFRLLLAGDECPIASSYEVAIGIFTVPAGFSMKVGHAGAVADIFATYPESTPFQLYVGETLMQTGETDRNELAETDGSEVRIVGRDMLKWLADYYIEADRTFQNKTFAELTRIALAEVGLTDSLVVGSNVANRKAVAGEPVPKGSVVEEQPVNPQDPTTPPGKKSTKHGLRMEVGTTWFDFLKIQFRRAGLFLWCGANGEFILSRPDGTQPPLYQIVRRRRDTTSPVLGQPKYFRDITQRFTEVHIYGRSGGGKDGRGRIFGKAVDEEMIAILNPDGSGQRKKIFVFSDKHVKTKEQADFLARRKMAEQRRAGFHLEYTVSGHTTPSLSGTGRIPWQPDTIVHVFDETLGINEPMWIESCTYKRTPHTTTTLNLIRTSDLVFAEEDFDTLPKAKVRKIRQGKTEVAVWVRDNNHINLEVAAPAWQDKDGKLTPYKEGPGEPLPTYRVIDNFGKEPLPP